MRGVSVEGRKLRMCDRAVKKERHIAEFIMGYGSLGFVKV